MIYVGTTSTYPCRTHVRSMINFRECLAAFLTHIIIGCDSRTLKSSNIRHIAGEWPPGGATGGRGVPEGSAAGEGALQGPQQLRDAAFAARLTSWRGWYAILARKAKGTRPSRPRLWFKTPDLIIQMKRGAVRGKLNENSPCARIFNNANRVTTVQFSAGIKSNARSYIIYGSS